MCAFPNSLPALSVPILSELHIFTYMCVYMGFAATNQASLLACGFELFILSKCSHNYLCLPLEVLARAYSSLLSSLGSLILTKPMCTPLLEAELVI